MKIHLYTRITPACSYCEGAKLFLQDNGYLYEETIIGKHITLEEFVETHPDKRTLPVVFIDDEFVGGYIELKEYIKQKELSEQTKGLSL